LCALPLLILFILKTGTLAFAGLVLVLSVVGQHEFCRMALPRRIAAHTFSCAAGVVVFLAALMPQVPFAVLLSCLVLVFGLTALLRITDIKVAAGEAGLQLLGLLYVPLLLSQLAALRQLPHGTSWIFLLLIIVMSGDTAAYYVGSSIGRRKLYPLVSPNKSIEGMFGGLAGSVVGTLLARATFFPELSLPDALVTAIFVGILGQLGDLFESLLKRSFAVKDSGNVFPGHGGMLDRLDSILFAAPTLYVYARYFF
jgi:phosphatidate cytidylyltransferase